jgi:hypothetical protein
MNASANAQHQQIQPTDTDGNPAANASVYNLANKAYFLSDSAGKTWIKTGADITIIANTNGDRCRLFKGPNYTAGWEVDLAD